MRRTIQQNRGQPDASLMFFDKFSIVWRNMPNAVGLVIAGLVTMILGSALRGQWLLVLVLAFKQFGINFPIKERTEPDWLETMGLKNADWYIITNVFSSALIYFALGGFLQWFFYVRQRSEPKKWKCQPEKFLSPEDEMHEVFLGTVNMMAGAALFSVIACYIDNGGYTTLYYDPAEYGWAYFFFSMPLVFILEDAGAYYYHRMLHMPFFYKRFHKLHHRYKSPTAFSATAMHPVEFFIFQSIIIAPLFLFPIHAGVYLGMLLYLYYYGMIDHSGINMTSIMPWQPPVMFHDDHHKYFHCNFGFNTLWFDKIHGTLRKLDRYYSEDVYGGKGRNMTSDEKDACAKAARGY